MAVPRTIVLEKFRSLKAYIKRAVMDREIKLLVITLLKECEINNFPPVHLPVDQRNQQPYYCQPCKENTM